MAYPLIPIVVFSMFSFFSRGDRSRIFVKNAALVCAAFAVLNFPVIIKFFRMFFLLDSFDNAWSMHMATLFDIAGLFNAFSNSTNKIVIVAVNCVFLFVIARQSERERLSSFLSVSSGAFLALYILFCFLYFREGEQSAYKSYKAAVSLSFVVVIPLLRFLEAELNVLADAFAAWCHAHGGKFDPGFFAKQPCKKNLGVAAVFVLVFSLNVSSMVNTYLRPLIGSDFPGVSRGHDALKVFAESRSHSGADYILNCAWKLNQLIAKSHLSFSRTFSNNYGLAGYDDMMKNSFKAGDIYVTDEYEIYKFDAKLLFENDIYKISELGEESILFYEFIGDFATKPVFMLYDEGSAGVKRITGRNVGFSFISLKPRTRNFHITFYNVAELGSPIKARAFFNNAPIGEFEIDERYEYVRLDGLPMIEGINSVTFEIDGDFSKIGVTDLRFSEDNSEREGMVR
jgi:hypothetical protein